LASNEVKATFLKTHTQSQGGFQNKDWTFGEMGGRGEEGEPLFERQTETGVRVLDPFITDHFTVAIKRAISELLPI
jgi:hypothetical protein